MTVDYRRHFDDNAEHYSQVVAPLFRVTHEHLVEWAASLPRPARVLDVACGDGRLSAALAAYGHQVVGCDQSRRLLRRAASAAPRAWLRADAHTLPLRTGGVDAAVCNLGVQFFDRPVDALREMRRVTRASGPVVVVVPESRRDECTSGAVPLPRLIEDAGFPVVWRHLLTETVTVVDVETLLAVWRVEMNSRPELAEMTADEQGEFAEVVLARSGNALHVPLRFSAYHCGNGDP